MLDYAHRKQTVKHQVTVLATCDKTGKQLESKYALSSLMLIKKNGKIGSKITKVREREREDLSKCCVFVSTLTFIEGDFGFTGGATGPGGLDVVVVVPSCWRRLTRKCESRIK